VNTKASNDICTGLEVASYVIDGGRAAGKFSRGAGDPELIAFFRSYQKWCKLVLSLFPEEETGARFWSAVELYSAFVEHIEPVQINRPAANIRLHMVYDWCRGDGRLIYETERSGSGDKFRHQIVPAQTEYPEGFVD
jgi:hypothetical protein